MHFSSLRFPDHLALGATGGPTYLTGVLTMANGLEQRNINWLVPIYKFNISNCIKKKSDLETIISFFRIHKGKAIGFKFRDWTDYTVHKEIIGVSGSNRIFQLKKSYYFQTHIDNRIIHKPLQGSVKIYADSKLVEATIDYETGKVALNKLEPGLEISASFKFDLPVRFDIDELKASSSYADIDIPLIEIKTILN